LLPVAILTDTGLVGAALGVHSVVGALLYSEQICLLCSGFVVLVMCTCLVLVRILVVVLLGCISGMVHSPSRDNIVRIIKFKG
jgi:hypothetical protein